MENTLPSDMTVPLNTIISGFQSSQPKNFSISISEEKELRRVYDRLCDYHIRSGINNEIRDLQSWQISARSKAKENFKMDAIVEISQTDVSHSATQSRIDELKLKLHELESNPLKSISVSDISEMFKFLNKKLNKKDFEEMMWEVDEDLNGCLDWTEFKLMFIRNVTDKTGLEPSRIFNMTQFMIYDVNNNGMVSVDETMNMLFNRFGKAKMESKLRELFGHNVEETGREGGEIDFSRFLDSFEKSQLNTFAQTAAGKLVTASKGAGKKLEALKSNLHRNY